MDHHRQTKTARRSRASLIILITLAFLLMAAAVVLVVSLPDDEAWQLPTATSEPAGLSDAGFSCEAAEAQFLYPFGAGVMKLTRNRAAFLDLQGNELYAVDLDYSTPFAVSGSGLFLAADRDGHAYVLLSATGTCYAGTLPGRISGASISPDGYVAIVQDQSDSTGVVTLLAPNTGAKLFDCYFPESGYVLSVSFPDQGGCFDVALLNTSASTAQPIIKRYSLEGKPLGQLKPDLTELYPLIAYDGQKHLVLGGAANLAALSYDQGAILWQRSFHQILAVRTVPAGLLVLASDEQDGQFKLHLLQPDGKDKTVLPAGDTITNLAVAGNRAALGCGTRIIAADSQTGTVILDKEAAAEVIRVGFTDSKTLIIITRNGVHRLSLPN